ncbi:MAG TPA: alpha/beta hydrolase [Xanthobacteraceae bacterium]|nr:alpha/beta hydrolase [Xanthobacteraceae bacterium]
MSEAEALALEDQAEHRYANNDGVKIHYALVGKGPLVVFLHGFPDYWLTWRHQMLALSKSFRTAALDMRGYNLSDKPKGVDNYKIDHMVADAAAVIAAEGEKSAVIVGHDWGGATAWNIAMKRPELCEKLAVLNMPHPYSLARELATNPEQVKYSQYARNFMDPEFYKQISLERLGAWVRDPAARARHLEAMQRSDPQAMLHYYQANYPREPYRVWNSEPEHVKIPTLLIHGLKDKALAPTGLNGLWNWVDADLTITTIPGADHFVQQDASDLVSRTLLAWLKR